MVRNEVMIGDSLTHGTKVVGRALHPITIVADAEITLLEDVEPDVELQNTGSTVAKELGLEHEPRLVSVLHQYPNDLVEFGGEGTKDLCHHDAVQPRPIDGVGVGVDGAIIIIVLGDRNPLGSGELLF
jgi:hypothetical protein